MLDSLDPKIQIIVDSQVKYIRRMSLLPDETLRMLLTQQVIEHPHLINNYEEEEQKRMLHEITKAAKDVKSDSLKLARKVA